MRSDYGLRALLIQKSIKLITYTIRICAMFESFVNSEEYQTNKVIALLVVDV